MKLKIKNLFLMGIIALGLNACKKEEPSKAMTTINGRFVEYGTDKGIEGLPVSLLKYVGLGFQYEQLTDIVYTDSAGRFTINYELEREGVYEIFCNDETFTYSDPGNGHHPFNFTLGKPINLEFFKYTPAWVNVRVINKSRPVYLAYTLDVWGDHATINQSDDTTIKLKVAGNLENKVTLNVYKQNSVILIEKSFPIKVQNWKTMDTTITF